MKTKSKKAKPKHRCFVCDTAQNRDYMTTTKMYNAQDVEVCITCADSMHTSRQLLMSKALLAEALTRIEGYDLRERINLFLDS